MKLSPIAIAVCAAVCLSAFKAAADDFTVGFNLVTCTGASDTVVTVPFRRPTSYSGTLSGAPAIAATTATLTAAGSPAFAAGEFTGEAHYLLFTGDGTRSGWTYPITANDATTLTIDLEGDDLSGVADEDPFEVIPHWTLETLFPKALQNTIHVSPNKLAPSRKTQVLFFNDTGDGINLAPDRIYFLTADGWFLSERGFPAADDVIIPAGKIFVIRHPAGEAATFFYPHQVVIEKKFSTPLRTRTAGPQDNPLGLVRPVPVELSDLDLDAAAFTESATTDLIDRKDELLVFDNVAAILNRQPSATYFRTGGAWHKDNGGSYPVADTDEISPSTGLLIRKAATAGGESQRWLNIPRVLTGSPMRLTISQRFAKPGPLALAAGVLLWLAGAATQARATVTVQVFFDGGTPGNGSVAVLVADVNADGFLPFTDASAVGTVLSKGQAIGGSDDVILAVLQADDGEHWNGTAGIADTIESLDYAEFGISPGTPLILYVFPYITQPGHVVASGDAVVTHRNTNPGGSGGEIGFVAPADPGVYILSALTAARGGSFDPQNPGAGETSNQAEAGVPGSEETIDDHRDTADSATPIMSGQTISGSLSEGDTDFFTITLAGSSQVIVHTTGATDTAGSLYDSGANLLNDEGQDDDGGTNSNFMIDEVVRGGGAISIAVRGNGGTATGNYDVVIEVIPLKDTPCPDATIGKSLTSQKGDDKYNRSGAGQKLKQVSKKGKKLKFFFKVQNDRDFPDDISVSATPKDKYFKANYFRISGGRTNVTAAFKRDNYQSTIDAQAEETFQLDVKPTRRAIRMKKTFMIDAKAAGGPPDRVKAEVKAK